MNYLELFKKNLVSIPNKVAVRSYNQEITYSDLDKHSDGLCFKMQKLCKAKKPVVAILGDGSVNHFKAIMACIKLGYCFINIDINWPKEYIKRLYEELNINLLLYQSKYNNKIYENVKSICLDNINYIGKYEIDCSKSKLLYIIPTSGTTGIYKLVMKKENALIRSFYQMKKVVPIMFDGVAQQNASLSFAFGLDQTLIMLVAGKTICVNKKYKYVDIKYIYKDIDSNKADTVLWPAAILKLLSKQPNLCEGMPECIKSIVVGGEPLVISADLIFELRNRDITLYNNYGCTEIGTLFFSAVDINLLNIEKYNRIPVGSNVLPGFEMSILDTDMKKVNKGELYVSDDKFFNHYVNTMDNKEKFINFIETDNKVLFRTEDIIEYIGGNYYIVGRTNNCINIRGYRVSIEHVERVISKVISGEDCCIIVITNQYLENNMVCFYSNINFSEIELRKVLKGILPDYMVPSKLIKINKIVYSPNGKIDRNKMKKLYESMSITSDSCQEDLRLRIRNKIAQMTGKKMCAEDDKISFYELGLDSLGFTDFICRVEYDEDIAIKEEMILSGKINTIDSLVEYIKREKHEEIF